MNLCKTCKHWRGDAYFAHEGTVNYDPFAELFLTGINTEHFKQAFYVSLKSNPDAEHGICLHNKMQSDDTNSWIGTKPYRGLDGNFSFAHYDDSEATVMVGRNFGCIHWEDKA